MYLKENVIGAASGIIYARQGDFVEIIRKDTDLTLVAYNNQKFFVRNEKLTEEKVNPSAEAIEESTNAIQRIRKRKR